MDTNARYSALEHGGLEVREVVDGPEVVEGTVAPIERRSSLNSPEIVPPGQNKQEHGNYFAGEDNEAAAPAYPEQTRPAYIDNDAKRPAVAAHEADGPHKSRRYCGMRRGVLIAVIVLAVVVILGAVLGGVLGTLLTKSSKKDSSATPPAPYTFNNTSTSNTTTTTATGPLEAMSGTGFAAAVSADGSGRLYMYYQDQDGRIIENTYYNDSWTLEDSSLLDKSVVTTDATARSPLAAVSYALNDVQYRQIFYIDGSGLVKTTNSTNFDANAIATSWSTPYAITDDPASTSGTAGLAACSDHIGMNGVRVYYGSGEGYVQEVGYQFNDTSTGWTEWFSFSDSDANSGVACVVYDDVEAEELYINVYMRNTSGIVTQNYWNYYDNDGWSIGPESSSNYSIASGSAIAVCNDDQQSEYVRNLADIKCKKRHPLI
ncbi:hypothetical protein LTR97_007328 [Elasticomyces elasticus]|uniref:Fucose-specific lectin n=1 Tax=Elasticomyces elasticus TaxID=574655 RepID=A0AAN7ZTA7_9PEZI|nr:hypothetical protein LTR97_007328 [Elasticomyces elasticus]